MNLMILLLIIDNLDFVINNTDLACDEAASRTKGQLDRRSFQAESGLQLSWTWTSRERVEHNYQSNYQLMSQIRLPDNYKTIKKLSVD